MELWQVTQSWRMPGRVKERVRTMFVLASSEEDAKDKASAHAPRQEGDVFRALRTKTDIIDLGISFR